MRVPIPGAKIDGEPVVLIGHHIHKWWIITNGRRKLGKKKVFTFREQGWSIYKQTPGYGFHAYTVSKSFDSAIRFLEDSGYLPRPSEEDLRYDQSLPEGQEPVQYRQLSLIKEEECPKNYQPQNRRIYAT
jgi:hypothetical protein